MPVLECQAEFIIRLTNYSNSLFGRVSNPKKIRPRATINGTKKTPAEAYWCPDQKGPVRFAD
jgi:hypothetical protein